VIRYKTAKLFEAAARLGGILGDDEGSAEAALGDFGTHLGTAFQIVDDVLDYSGEDGEIGKHLGDDLAEGKPTLPLIHVMRQGAPAQAALVRNALEQGGREAFPEIIQAVQATGALGIAMDVAQAEADLAKQSLAALPDTNYREALIQLSAFAITRRH
jgi:octaprenyl-diphosphate synthase